MGSEIQQHGKELQPLHYVSTLELDIGVQAVTWLRKHLATPTPKIKRHRASAGEAVCPFLRKSIESGHCYLSFISDVKERGPAYVRQCLLGMQEEFASLPPLRETEKTEKSLLVLFPDAPANAAKTIDSVYENVRTDFIRAGLMIARFHNACEIGSIWNPQFKVFSSPFPFMAIRHMALHDVFFAAYDPILFYEYDCRFGGRFSEGRFVDQEQKRLIRAYRRAKTEFQKYQEINGPITP